MNHKRELELKICGEKVIHIINNPYDNKKLKFAIEEYLKENKIQKIQNPNNIDIGNGKFDKPAIQKTQNSWAHAGLNALLSTPKGKKLIDCNSYRDLRTGTISVHLQEAEDNAFHQGIYIITPQEILEASQTLSFGDGDVTAYMAAIDKYFAEVRSNPDLEDKMAQENLIVNKMQDGNYGFRLFEILTGAISVEFDSTFNYNNNLKTGIAIGSHIESEQLYNLVKDKKGAVTITLRNHEYTLSVIGVKDNCFLVQESGNTQNFQKINTDIKGHTLFKLSKQIKGVTTYELPKEYLDKTSIATINYIKWDE